jgi:2-phosphosulfolactate phosphatase
MKIELLPLPSAKRHDSFAGRACAVFDVLRATTTITAALAAGVREIHLFPSLDEARHAAESGRPVDAAWVLCGERECLPPPGFHLGNSPGQFDLVHRDAIVFMCTTNGTRALLAAREAELILPAALVNASAVAEALLGKGLDVTLVCAGTNGEVADEDLFGAGAVIHEITRRATTLELSGEATMALTRFRKGDAREVLRASAGGQNVIRAGLEADIDFAARLNVFPDVVGVAAGDPLVVRPYPFG